MYIKREYAYLGKYKESISRFKLEINKIRMLAIFIFK